MFVYEVMQCEQCSRTYKGKFKWHMNGEVTCISCTDPEHLLGLSVEEVQYEKRQEIMYPTLSDHLIHDLEHLYPLVQEEYDEVMAALSTGEVTDHLPLIYYQYNDYQLVRVFREIAYMAAHYLLQSNEQQQDKELYAEARVLLDAYFSLRKRLLTNSEIQELWGHVTSEQVYAIKLTLLASIEK